MKKYTLSSEVNDFFNFFHLTVDFFLKDQDDVDENLEGVSKDGLAEQSVCNVKPLL